MKKMFYFVAVATFALISCQQDEEPVNGVVKNEPITFKASIENLGTRADMNASNGLKWVTGDKIGIYVNDDSWDDKNQPFTLVGNGGSATGEFAWDNGKFTNTNAKVAFFPWQGTSSSNNNVFEGTMYFKLPDSYYGYTSGKMLTPLIASLENSSSNINFKHAGAALKVTINNLPVGAHSIGMTVEGQQVYGDYSINPASAGVVAMAASVTDNTKNSVWLNYTNNSQSAWTFIFPVPTLTTPKLSFQIWDKNNILVWSKNLKAQTNSLGRADILVMDPISIPLYSQFRESTDGEWNFCGTINGAQWANDVHMYTDGTIYIFSGRTFKDGDEFKLRYNKKWKNDGGDECPSSNWKFDSGNAGAKDIIFDSSKSEIRVVDAGCPYPNNLQGQ